MTPRLKPTLALAAATSLPLLLVAGWVTWSGLRADAIELAEQHLTHDVAHPGWSFPARVWSAPAELDLPMDRLLLEAEARGYTSACPPTSPGEVCPETGDVQPKGGVFPEGRQPPGHESWTRPPALEPLLLGLIVGPHGEVREHLPLDEAPDHLLEAILVAEDADYHSHRGANLRSTLRAMRANYQGRGWHQGASTITMQVVRAFSQEREKRLSRKLRETAMAVALDSHLGKERILQAYLDIPYLGQAGSLSICGFQAAARYYWGRDARDLTLGQAATLAAILPSPGRYAPDRNPDGARERRDRLLRRMAELGHDRTAVVDALAEPIEVTAVNPVAVRHPAYMQATRGWIQRHVDEGVLHGAGLDIHTAMDVVAQGAGETSLTERLAWVTRTIGVEAGVLAATALVDNETGLLAAVMDTGLGSATSFSRATQARRQPGSSFKPVVYAMALDSRSEDGEPLYTAASTMPNSPRRFKGTEGWSPRNVAGEYSPTSCLAMGMAWSQNIATASLLESLGGPDALAPFAARLGFNVSAWPMEMGLALGQGEVTVLEMASFVSTVVSGGVQASGRPVLLARDAAGQIRIPPPPAGQQALSPEAAALTRDLMRLVVDYGTGGRARGTGGVAGYAGPVVGKTGTTDDERDLWFVGSTPRYAGALWLGHDTPRRIGVPASDLAAPLWGWWMRALHDGLPQEPFQGPKLERRNICTITGLPGNGTCQLIPAPFLPGTAPKGTCPQTHEPPPPPPPDALEWRSRWDTRGEDERSTSPVP